MKTGTEHDECPAPVLVWGKLVVEPVEILLFAVDFVAEAVFLAPAQGIRVQLDDEGGAGGKGIFGDVLQ